MSSGVKAGVGLFSTPTPVALFFLFHHFYIYRSWQQITKAFSPPLRIFLRSPSRWLTYEIKKRERERKKRYSIITSSAPSPSTLSSSATCARYSSRPLFSHSVASLPGSSSAACSVVSRKSRIALLHFSSATNSEILNQSLPRPVSSDHHPRSLLLQLLIRCSRVWGLQLHHQHLASGLLVVPCRYCPVVAVARLELVEPRNELLVRLSHGRTRLLLVARPVFAVA